MCIFFFFSSRRRHTRCSRDWSSDVCSSDLAACAVGAGVTWGLGLPGLALLTAFFLTGSVLTQLAERRGPSRNARQVLANGGVALLAALLGSWAAAAGAIAAAAADTWATEIRAYSPFPPRLLTSRGRVTR